MNNKLLVVLLLIFLLIIWPLVSYFVTNPNQVELKARLVSRSTQIYLPTILIELLVLLLIIFVLRKGNENLTHIGFVDFNLTNLFIGIAFWGLAYSFISVISFLFKLSDQKTQQDLIFLLPKNKMDKSFWILMSLAAGICEEAGFRGFVLTKLNFWIKNWWLTAIISSSCFGLGHLYQGLDRVILTAIYGFLFCLVFIWRKSLFPGIVAHTLQDAIALFFLV